jgi:antitoxin ParD1/3/4
MNVSLTPELEAFVETRLKSGRYGSATDVVREAFRLLEDHERSREAELEEFRAEIDDRLASLDQGQGVDAEEAFARLRLKLAKRQAGMG